VIRAVLFDFGETLVERISDEARPLSELRVTAFADAAPTLSRLREGGHLLAIVSNTTQSTENHMVSALKSIGLDRFFHAVVTSFDVGHDKPDPAIFHEALGRLSCSPHEAAMVGDDAVKDIGGAALLGLTTILVRRGAALPAGPAVPTFTVHSLSEIPGLLDSQ
jgi:putative hydrolase of the HAD superfamily